MLFSCSAAILAGSVFFLRRLGKFRLAVCLGSEVVFNLGQQIRLCILFIFFQMLEFVCEVIVFILDASLNQQKSLGQNFALPRAEYAFF
jgi:hypothetical protein